MMHGRIIYTNYWKPQETNPDKKKLQQGLTDVTDPSFWGLGLPAYGWKRALSLAKKGEDLGKRKAADNNAETLALFASGKHSPCASVWLIADIPKLVCC